MEHRAASEAHVVACYREFAPHPALVGIVRALFSFTPHSEAPAGRRITFEVLCGAGDACPSPMFADGSSSIVFDLGAIFRANGTWHDSTAALGGKVIGAMRIASPPSDDGLPAAVGAYLHPGQLEMFAHALPCQLTDRVVRIEELWDRSARGLAEQIVLLGESGRLDLLEGALLRQMARARGRRSALDIPGVAECIFRRGGQVSIASLATAAGVSRQQLTRVFRERVGVSPKVYCRLARFHTALAYVRDGDSVDWARAACDAGYTDQSHMIAEFRQFSSLTPHKLATERWLHPFVERAKRSLKGSPQAGSRTSTVSGDPEPTAAPRRVPDRDPAWPLRNTGPREVGV